MQNFETTVNKDGFRFTFYLNDTAAATGTNYDIVFPIDAPCEVAKVTVRYSAASTSGTLQLQKLTGTTAPGSGNNILTTALSLSATANTWYQVIEKQLNKSYRVLNPGDALGLSDGGTLTNLKNLSVIIYLRPTNKGHYN